MISRSDMHAVTSWYLPPGRVFKAEMVIRTQLSDLIQSDIAPFLDVGFSATSVEPAEESSIIKTFDSMQAHMLLSEIGKSTLLENDLNETIPVNQHLYAPGILFADSGVRSAFDNAIPGTAFALRSTFPKPVQIQSLQASCSKLFDFADLTTQTVSDGTSFVQGNVKLLLKCTYHVPDIHSEDYTHMYNIYACSHFWLLVRSRVKACQKSGSLHHSASDSIMARLKSDYEQDLLARTTELAEELMFAMRERYRGFYRQVQSTLESAASQRQAVGPGHGLSTTYDPAYLPQGPKKIQAQLSLDERRKAHRHDLEFWGATSASIKKSKTVSLPALHSNIFKKLDNFMKLWKDGSKKYGWDTLEDEVIVNAAVMLDGQSHPKNLTFNAFSEEINATSNLAKERQRSKVSSSFIMPRITGTKTITFSYMSYKNDTSLPSSTSHTPVGHISHNFIIIQNPTAVPIKVRLSTITHDAAVPDLKTTASSSLPIHLRHNHHRMYHSNVYLQTADANHGKYNLPSQSGTPNIATQMWWTGGSYFMYSRLDNHLLQSNHNITIRSAGGSNVSLLNPSVQTVNALSTGCGKRCAIRNENMSTERSESVLGSAAARKIKLLHESSGMGGSYPAAFALPFQATEEKIVPPFGLIKLGPILFRPPVRGEFRATIAVENSVTGADKVDLIGLSGVKELSYFSWRSEDDMVGYDEYMPPFRANSMYYKPRPNPFYSGVSNIELRHNFQSLVFTGSANAQTHSPVVKTLHLVNTGNIALDIESVYLSSGEILHFTSLQPHPRDYSKPKQGCESNGFRLLSCITKEESLKRKQKFEQGVPAFIRRWLVKLQKLDPYMILPEHAQNVAEGFFLEPGEKKTLFIAHVADCTYPTMFVTLNIKLRGQNSPTHGAVPKGWRNSFQTPKTSILVGYEMKSSIDECHIAKPRAQGVLFSKSGRDPIGMHMEGTYPITYYAADTLFNRLAAGHHKKDQSDLFIYTASMFFEHSAVALVVSMAFLLLVHAFFYFFDRFGHSKTLRAMWRQNVSFRYTMKDWLRGSNSQADAGWRKMLTISRYFTGDNADLSDIQNCARETVKSSILTRLKGSLSPNNLALDCINPHGTFVLRSPQNYPTMPYCPEDRLQIPRHDCTVSHATFRGVDWHKISGHEGSQWQLKKQRAGLDWRAASAANIFVPKSLTDILECKYTASSMLNQSRMKSILLKRIEDRNENGSPVLPLELEIQFDHDDSGILEVESNNDGSYKTDEAGVSEAGVSNECDEEVSSSSASSADTSDQSDDSSVFAEEDNDDEQFVHILDLNEKNTNSINVANADGSHKTGQVRTISSQNHAPPSPSWNVQRRSANKRDLPVYGERVVAKGFVATSKLSMPVELKSGSPRMRDTSSTKKVERQQAGIPTRAWESSNQAVPKNSSKRRVVTSRAAMSLEKRVAIKGSSANVWQVNTLSSNKAITSIGSKISNQQTHTPSNAVSDFSAQNTSVNPVPQEDRNLLGPALLSTPQHNPVNEMKMPVSLLVVPQADANEAQGPSPPIFEPSLGSNSDRLFSETSTVEGAPAINLIPDKSYAQSTSNIFSSNGNRRIPSNLPPPPGFESPPRNFRKPEDLASPSILEDIAHPLKRLEDLATHSSILEDIPSPSILVEPSSSSFNFTRAVGLSSDPWAALDCPPPLSPTFHPLDNFVKKETGPFSLNSDLREDKHIDTPREEGPKSTTPLCSGNPLHRLSSLSQSIPMIGDVPLGGSVFDDWKSTNPSPNHEKASVSEFNVENFVLNFLARRDSTEEEGTSILNTAGDTEVVENSHEAAASTAVEWDPSAGEFILPRSAYRCPIGSAIASDWVGSAQPVFSRWTSDVDVDSAAVAPLTLACDRTNETSIETGDLFGNKRSSFFANLVRDVVDEDDSDNLDCQH